MTEPTKNITLTDREWAETLPTWARLLYAQAKKNAVKRRIKFELSEADFAKIVTVADRKCQVSGIEFDFSRAIDGRRRPFAPSLDRKDSFKGYSFKNCRLVCVIVNFALNEWGLMPLYRLVIVAMTNRSLRQMKLIEAAHAARMQAKDGSALRP